MAKTLKVVYTLNTDESSKILEMRFLSNFPDVTGTLEVTFTPKKGKLAQTYEYYNVEFTKFQDLCQAESLGQAHNELIINGGYKYQNVTTKD